MNNQKQAEEIRDRFIEEIGRLGESLGLNRMTCQLYGLLYLEDGPLSLTELSRILHISKGSASLNIRKLEEWGAAKSVWRKGSNQNYYQANRDLWEIMKKRVRLGLEKRLSTTEESMAELTATIKERNKNENPPEHAKRLRMYRERIQEIRNFSKKSNKLMSFF